MKKMKKVVSALMLVITLLMQFSNVFAAFDVTSAGLIYDRDCGHYLDFNNGNNKWGEVITGYVEYQAPNGQKYPAYCLDAKKPGVGNPTLGDTPDGYTVNIEKLLDRDDIYTAIINGYPYKTPQEMGVADKYDAYQATKHAVYCIIYGHNVDEKYRGIGDKGNSIMAAMRNIVNIARTSPQSQRTALISFSNNNEFGPDANTNYYSQTYTVNSDIDMKEYTITATSGLPEGSYIADTSGSRKMTFSAGETFKIMIPKEQANKTASIDGVLAVQARCKNYPVFYASKDNSLQPYGITYDPYGDNSGQLRVNYTMNTGKIVINKTDSENSKTIEGVTFQLQKQDGTVVASSTTTKNGVATFSNLLPGKYKLKEISTSKNYVLNDSTFDINVEYNQTTTKDITNNIKKGKIKVIKVDLDERETKLQGVEFKIYDEDGKLVDTIVTDKNGEATSKDLRIDKKYKIQESRTLNNYVLNGTPQTVTLQYNQITNVTFTNEAKKGQIKVIKVDEDFNEIKLQGVEFKIYDEDGKLVDTIVTDKNGEATSKKLRIDKKYTVKESKTLSNYILNEEPQTVTLQYNQITNVTFENEHQKGDLKIYKVDKDNHKVTLGNVEFKLYSEEFGKVIGTYRTDVNGEIKIENLRTGNYRLIESITNKWYNLATDTNIKIEWNNITNTTIENELKKGQVRVIKIDKDNNEVKLEGVEFEVLDENNKVLEKIITNKNGEALTSKYPVRDFEKLKIRESRTLDTYVLSQEQKTVTLKENQIQNITFQNEKKKGQIKVIKVDLDNTEVKIPDVEFKIYDESGKVVDTLITDKNGEAVSKRLPIDQQYQVRETKTGNLYVLNNEPQTVTLKQDQITNMTFTNEKKKGQIRIIKVDLDNKEVLLEGVTFDILDEQGNVVDTIRTNEKGEAVSKRLPIDQKYTALERETKKEYVLSEEKQTIELKQDEITSITFENEKIKGYVEITKIDSETKETLKDAKFGIYNEKNELVGTLTTDENGKSKSELLPYGKYYLKELSTGSPYYLLNKDTYEFEITKNHETIPLTIENDGVDIEVTVDKEGTSEIKPGEKVDYVFNNVANASNIYLENFKWFDYIPTDYIRLEKMTTGTWNQDLTYSVYYKTNKSDDYILFKENLSTQENYDLDFTTIQLAEDEYIIETMYDFGKVDVGFRESTAPTMQCKSFDTLKDGETFTNYTKTVGVYYGITADSDSKWTTVVHVPEEKHEPVLPRTGE